MGKLDDASLDSSWTPAVIDPSQPGTAYAYRSGNLAALSLEIIPEPGCSQLSLCGLAVAGAIFLRTRRQPS